MGHLINPISYRLGVSKCWNSTWMQNFSFRSNYISLIKSDYDIFLFFRRFFDLKLLIQSGYIFSHVKIIREYSKLFCVVYFYDGGSLERSDNMRNIFLSNDFQEFMLLNLFFLSLSSFLKLYQWNFGNFRLLRNFKFNFLFHYFSKKKKFLLLKFKLRRIFMQIVSNQIIKDFKFLWVYEGSFLSNKKFFFFFYAHKVLRFFELKNFNFFLQSFNLSQMFLCFNNQNNNLLFQNILSLLNKIQYLKMNFYKTYSKYLLNLFFFKRWKIIIKITYFAKMIQYIIKAFSFSRYFLYYISDTFFFSVRISSRLNYALKMILKNLFLAKNNTNIRIFLKKLEVTELNATIISKYLAVRLRQRFQLREVLLPMLRHLTNTFFVRGFRVTCAGRFTRKEIALYDVRTYSSVPFSSAASYLDFSLSEVILKYSICGIKVWLHRNIISENFFSINGIGLNFIQAPDFPQDFINLLKEKFDISTLNFKSQSFGDNKFFFQINQLAKKKLYLNSLKRKKFVIKQFLRMLPAIDFFFFKNQQNFNKIKFVRKSQFNFKKKLR